MYLRRVDGRGDRHARRDRRWRSLRNRCRLRRLRPAKLLHPVRDHLLDLRRPSKFRSLCCERLFGCLAVRLPSQGGCNTDTNSEQEAGEPSRASLFHLVFDCSETIINRSCALKPLSRGEEWTPDEGHPEGLPVLSFRESYVIVGLIFHQNQPHHRLTGVHQFQYSQPFHPHVHWRASQLKVLVVAVLMDLWRRHCGRTPRFHLTDNYFDEIAPSHPQGPLFPESGHQQPHSITSSARPSSNGGMSRSIALAVLRLMTSSNFVGAWIGRSAGFSPLRMRSMYSGTWRNCSTKSVPKVISLLQFNLADEVGALVRRWREVRAQLRANADVPLPPLPGFDPEEEAAPSALEV